MKKAFLSLLFTAILALSLSACAPTSEPTPSLPPTPTEAPVIGHLVFSEVLAGIDGNNPYDFIELYNPTATAVNLKGYAIWYALNEGDEATLLLVWDHDALIPPQGHYLLGQEGQDFGLIADKTFNQSLLPQRGGLVLRNLEREIVDSLGWGDAPLLAVEGQAALAMENGVSLERGPGSMQGNGQDQDSNAQDFFLNQTPSPQNSGSPITPAPAGSLEYTVTAPATASTGEEFQYTLQVRNQTGQELQTITAFITLPGSLTIQQTGAGTTQDGQSITWMIDSLGLSEEATTTITVTAPWTYTNVTTHSYYVQAENWPLPSFGGPLRTSIEGGSIPIITARTLVNQEVVIEGIATMYTGGFYAGSGAKFYLSDETAGAQVYVAGAGTTLQVRIGDRVRVRGIVTVYRDSIEIVPSGIGAVEILESDAGEIPPVQVSVREAANNAEPMLGALVQVEGTLARVEEFSYSYEIDMVDEEGQLLTLYVDKETGMTTETIQSGDRYRATGIMEILDGNIRLYPRLQTDLEQIYPETVFVRAIAPVSVETGEEFPLSFEVTNHIQAEMSDIHVVFPIPANLEITSIGDGGNRENQEVIWHLDPLEGNGASAQVSLTARITPGSGFLTIENYLVAGPWADPIRGEPTYVFSGGTVPIWAIQGKGTRSPYLNLFVETQGVVTAVFPELDGFWLQETITDSDPLTSAGVFVDTTNLAPDLTPGDFVLVRGVVREAYQQTQLTLGGLPNLEVLDQATPLPNPVALDPPAKYEDSLAYYESLEGMLVTVNQEAYVVAPSNRYGEFGVVLAYHDRQRLYQGEENGIIIMADDGSTRVHEYQSTLDYAVAVGDTITNLTGPLAFSFGNYKIEPTNPPSITAQPVNPPQLPLLGEDEFSIMTWNVENLFDIKDPHPSSPPLPTVSEYRQQITKVAQTILSSGVPTVIGLQEVENIGVLEDIAEHDLLAPYGYIPVLIEGTDSRGIDVGYLVRGDRASVLEEKQYPAPEGITSRPPLLVKVQLEGSEVELILLNNHFTSMSGGEAATEPRRNAQAAWNVTVMEEILAEDPAAYLSVIGDLNSYFHTRPIDTLRNAGLVHVFERLPAEERYTYVYQGVSQTLDHIMVTPSLDALIQQVYVLHVNADYPIPAPDDSTPLHKSDHDPVIVIFSIP